MTNQETIDFASLQAALTSNDVQLHASELHGVISGLISAGMPFESSEYLTIINDMFNNGEGLPINAKNTVKGMVSQTWQAMLDDQFAFQLLLPDDDESLLERCHALAVWVQGYNLGFGLQQTSKASLSDDVKEVLNDFSEIANLSEDLEEDEDTEQAFYEISEYVRISSLLCFSELGVPPEDKKAQETLH
ncbi:UPF0149 family protein [Thalassotalea agarivorans]|uniref:YecA family protein n=1 Tax=Thalassotalea agarivorans TaxID=349064 RepID=A0A1I0HFZ6_THASX|nr:UPF0149 family protein [Thalassotalea agarivorans]SET82620.1 hypothetical protein SAMN05660429_02785 [Thalassotalea agarivorans]